MKVMRNGRWVDLTSDNIRLREIEAQKAKQREADEKAVREVHAEAMNNGDIRFAAITKSIASSIGIKIT